MIENVPVTYLIYQAERAMHLQLNKALQENGFPILIEQWPVLSTIYYSNGMTQQELADFIKKDKTTLTRILNTLEKNDLIRRESSDVDRRKKHLYHTKCAEEMCPKIIELLKSQGEFIMNGLDQETKDIMRKGLGMIFKNLHWEFKFTENNYSFK